MFGDSSTPYSNIYNYLSLSTAIIKNVDKAAEDTCFIPTEAVPHQFEVKHQVRGVVLKFNLWF